MKEYMIYGAELDEKYQIPIVPACILCGGFDLVVKHFLHDLVAFCFGFLPVHFSKILFSYRLRFLLGISSTSPKVI
jgi:hypothetical protein